MAASLSVVAVFVTARAEAELIGSEKPSRALVASALPVGEYALHLDLPHFTPLLVMPIGLWNQGGYHLMPEGVTMGDAEPTNAMALCLGEGCPLTQTIGLQIDPRSATPNACRHVIEGAGGIAATALRIFATPMPRKEKPFAIGLMPMFAMGGAGLEFRGAWW